MKKYLLLILLSLFITTEAIGQKKTSYTFYCKRNAKFHPTPSQKRNYQQLYRARTKWWYLCRDEWEAHYGTRDKKRWFCKKRSECLKKKTKRCLVSVTPGKRCKQIKKKNDATRAKLKKKAELSANRYCKWHSFLLCEKLRKPAYFKCVKRVKWSRNYDWKKKQCQPYYDKVKDCLRFSKPKKRDYRGQRKRTGKAIYDFSDKRVKKFYRSCMKKKTKQYLKKHKPNLKKCFKYTVYGEIVCNGWPSHPKKVSGNVCWKREKYTCSVTCSPCKKKGVTHLSNHIP